jgi:hypothetical protein
VTHEVTFQRLGPKFDFVKQHKPRWYEEDERSLQTVERRLDDQIHRINKKAAKPKPFKAFGSEEPEGVRAAERGR